MRGIKGFLRWAWDGGEQRSSLRDPDAAIFDALTLGTTTASGISVSADKAMQLSAVSACVRLIAESIASLPLDVYTREPDGGRKRAVGHPTHQLLHAEPNPLMTSFVFREMLAAQVLLKGNAYAPIIRNGAAQPVELLPVLSDTVRVRRSETMGLVYDLQMPDGRSYTLGQADVLHVPGLSFDGITGVSPIKYAAQAIGLGLAAEQYGAAWFGNGSTPAGYISMAGKLNKDQAAAMRDSWYAAYGGLRNANKTAVLFDGAKFERISIPPNEAQFIETRKFQVSEIARWYRVPPHMIGDLERATFSNIEHQQLEFVTHTLRPWLIRFEQEINRKLFPSSTDGTPARHYCEFNVDGLLRGDIKSRSDYYVRGRQWGWLSANDIRAKENMEPIDGGNVYLTPLNMVNGGTNADASTSSSTEPTNAGQ
jgi:HK97 family phage portal protein